MRKVILMILTIGMVLSFAACSSGLIEVYYSGQEPDSPMALSNMDPLYQGRTGSLPEQTKLKMERVLGISSGTSSN